MVEILVDAMGPTVGSGSAVIVGVAIVEDGGKG